MKIGNIVKIKDIDANHPRDVGKIGIVIKVYKGLYGQSGSVCDIQTPKEKLHYHEDRLEVINAIH